jgi:hypothetical protein
MEISDEKLRQIVRETLRELGAQADPALVRKVVREVVRQLQKQNAPGQIYPAPKLSRIEPETPRTIAKTSGGASQQGY